jgi:hypothetical protein
MDGVIELKSDEVCGTAGTLRNAGGEERRGRRW